MFLGSSCIYPRDCPQPIKEEYLLTGQLEQTNEPYGIAKIASIKLFENYNRQYGTQFLSVMPTKPDGTSRKVVDVSRMAALGWKAKVGLREGVRVTCKNYLAGRVRETIKDMT